MLCYESRWWIIRFNKMVVTESCENNAAVSNGPVVLNGHAREDLTNGTMSKEVVSQNPERIDETKECLVQRKVSLRLQNRAKVKYDKYQKWSMSNGSNEKKKTKLNPSMQQQAYYCRVMAGGVDLVSNFTNAFPQGMDLRTILRLKEILRLVNLKKLQSAEVIMLLFCFSITLVLSFLHKLIA